MAAEGADTPYTYERLAILGERHNRYFAACRGAAWSVIASHENNYKDDKELRRIARIHQHCPAPHTDRWQVRRAVDGKVYGPYNRSAIAEYAAQGLVEISDEVFNDNGDCFSVIQLIAIPAQPAAANKDKA